MTVVQILPWDSPAAGSPSLPGMWVAQGAAGALGARAAGAALLPRA